MAFIANMIKLITSYAIGTHVLNWQIDALHRSGEIVVG